MTARKTSRGTTPSQGTTVGSKRKMILSSDVGVTLRVSDKALKKIDRLHEENIKAAKEGRKFSWR